MKAIVLLVSVIFAFHPVSVKADAPMVTEDYAEQCGLSMDEFVLFSSCVEAESDRNTEDITGRIYIALVIWNRTTDDRFNADTITEVLNAPGQFSTIRNGQSVTDRTELSDQAVYEAYCWIQQGDAPNVLFFNCRGYNYGEPYDCIGGNYFMTLEE